MLKEDEIIDKDEVLKMARQAGMEVHSSKGQIRIGSAVFTGDDTTKQVEAFAKLVAVAAASKEREACANLCEDQAQEYYSDGSKRAMNYQCADAIRARGKPTSRGEA